MKCPECNHEFGDLKLEALNQVGNLTEFNCPNCNQKLNNRPIKEITSKGKLYIHGGVVLVLTILLTNYLLHGSELTLTVKHLLIIVGSLSCFLGYFQFKKLEHQVLYEKVD